MRFLVLFVFFFGIQNGVSASELPKPVLPDKNLTEIIFYGTYYGKKGQDLKKWSYPSNQRRKIFYPAGKSYCYNKNRGTSEIYDQSLKVQLYNREGEKLAENFLLAKGSLEDSRVYYTVSYLPYRSLEQGEIRLIQIAKEGKEYVLGKYPCCPSEKDIISNASTYEYHNRERIVGPGIGLHTYQYVYHKEAECFYSLNEKRIFEEKKPKLKNIPSNAF